MAQLKSTTINGNRTVTGNINGCNIANINSNANTALSTANTALTRAN